MHVAVLGAGIVGLAAAWQLQRRGFRVTVVDRAMAGAGASGGNGAQLSYSYVQPLADPGIWQQLPKLLLSRDSPLKLRPRLDPLQWRWGVAFLRACNLSTSHQSTMALLQLAAESRAGFDAMRDDIRPACDFSETGKLVLYPDAASLDGARRQLEFQRALGSVQRVVDADECVAIEPALASYRARFAGAVHTPSECAADCLKLCHELVRALDARGVQFEFGTTATGFDGAGRHVAAVKTTHGAIEADAFVVSLGTASQPLGRLLGVDLMVYPLKGYSITASLDSDPARAPRVSVTDAQRKVVFARLGERLRVAGMAELVGHDTRIPADRIRALAQATQTLFPGASRLESLEPWTGMRPATPTGVPVIGRLPAAPDNVIFNTGHGALGFTLAFGSGARVADLLAGRGIGR